ncbi:hypothetical protein E6H17_07560 [Candidatus Bathyarchaeota archaeon]|nr:MAG: hypothetical protein E6H17_07560 [Candidatus Bathyarchaeota archaeon]TMI74960.1 MAG: hypothetical protein E6H11_01995 [Candidatus Bathyarchaeota archaeon]
MPKQLVFYMSKEDEEAFLQYLRSTGDPVILPATSPSSDFAPIAFLPEPTEDEATRKFWLQNNTVRLPLATEYAPEKNCYVIDGFQSPVVEFQRSWIVSNMMLAGGIRADMNYLDSDKQDLAPKPAEFRNWFESIQNWIRKNFFHLTLLTYVGPGAEKFSNEGGILH